MLKLSDILLWIIPLLLVSTGLLMILSTTFNSAVRADTDPFLYVKKQSVSAVIGIICMFGFSLLNYKNLKQIAPALYVFMLVLLSVVLFVGKATLGAQRWIMLGPLSFQPSEFAKILLIISLAAFYSNNKENINIFKTMAIVVVPFLLIFKQPDLGTSLVFIAISLGMLIWGKASSSLIILIFSPILTIIFRQNLVHWIIYLLVLWGVLYFSRIKYNELLLIMGINIAIGIAAPILWGLLKPYQQMRLLSFINPAADPKGMGYHTMQSKIAIGAGGLVGKGFMQGTQTQLQFVPIQNSDFIFSAIAEEFGFLGSIFIIMAFIMLIWRIFKVAENANDFFGSMLAAGCGAMIFFHFFVSIGMNLGVLPVVGIPLPFVSFGGSSLIVNMILIGIVQGIAMRRQKLIF
jgi:rod shape determining protein RodA